MPRPMSLFRLWQCTLQFALILWIVRVALAMTVLGLLILEKAPQAQDLFVEFADVTVWSVWRMLMFVCILIVVWAMPTHYAARLLLDTDQRFRQLLAGYSRSPLLKAACPASAGADIGRTRWPSSCFLFANG